MHRQCCIFLGTLNAMLLPTTQHPQKQNQETLYTDKIHYYALQPNMYIHKAMLSLNLPKNHTYLHTTSNWYIHHNQQTHNKHTYFLLLLQGDSI